MQADYDKSSGGFVINTPDDTACKFWIGNTAQWAKLCTLFVQLHVGGQWQVRSVSVLLLGAREGAVRELEGLGTGWTPGQQAYNSPGTSLCSSVTRLAWPLRQAFIHQPLSPAPPGLVSVPACPPCQGPHVLLVRLRDDQGNLMPGVTIKDLGEREGGWF